MFNNFSQHRAINSVTLGGWGREGRGASWWNAPTTNVGSPTRDLQNIKDKHADQPAKKPCDTLSQPRVASVEPPWLETTHFQKCVYVYARCFVRCYRVLWVINALTVRRWQRCFLRSCVHTIHSLCITALHAYVSTYVCTCTHTGNRCKHRVHGLATGLFYAAPYSEPDKSVP